MFGGGLQVLEDEIELIGKDEEMESERILKEETRKEFNDWLRRNGFPGGKPKGQREWDSVTRSIRASKKAGEPRYKCDDIVDYDGEEWVVKGSWVREDKGENEYKLTNMDDTETIYVLQSEIENPMHNESSEPTCGKCRRRVNESSSIRKKIDGKTAKQWYEWLKEENMGCCHLSVGQTAKNDICICMGWHDDGEDGSIAWKIGQQSFRNAMQSDLDVDFDMPYDPETGDVYDTLSYLDGADSRDFDWDRLADEMNSTAQEVYEYACEVDGTDDDDLYEESLTNEGLQEDVLDMSDREDELVWMIQDTFWHLADLGDPDILRELIENCVELEKVKPGRLKEIISDEF